MHQFGDPGSKCQDLCAWKKILFCKIVLNFGICWKKSVFLCTVYIYPWLKKQITDSLVLKVVFTQRVEYKL